MARTAASGDPRLARVRVVLVETSHPGNVGACARAMKSMGLARLDLVRPKRFPSADATARAAGADDLLVRAAVWDSLAEAVAGCGWVVGTSARDRRHIDWPSMDARACAEEAVARLGASEVALVFGRENSGLSNAELDLCHALVSVPAVDAFRSLNLAAAVQVLAYELRREVESAPAGAPAPPGTRDDPPATAAELEGLFEHLERTLIAIEYLDPHAPKLLMRRLRRLFVRAQPLRSEVNILRGVLTAAGRKRGPRRG